jgi:hypothetical protein
MNKPHLLLGVTLAWAFASICAAQTSTSSTTTTTSGGSTAPYTEGPVWTITMVKTKPGMEDDYLKNLAQGFRATNEEAKKQGLIMDYKILIGNAATPQDFNILLMAEYKNMAALDNARDKFDPIATKIIGNEDAQRQGSIKRMEIREIMGGKLMREITLK